MTSFRLTGAGVRGWGGRGARDGAGRRGFTITEILIVVAIIVILIAIILPSLAGAKRRAKYTETSHLLTAIGNAIDAYFQVFNDYPGPLTEATTASAQGISGPQNLSMGLMGFLSDSQPALPPVDADSPWPAGWVALPGGGNIAMRPQHEAWGVNDLSRKAVSASGTRHQAFYMPKPGEIAYASGTASAAGAPLQIPVLFDRFADPLPILYFRANRTMYQDAQGKWKPAETRPILADNAGGNANAAFFRLSNQQYICSSNTDGVTPPSQDGGLLSPSGARFPQDSSAYFTATNTGAPSVNNVTFSSYLEKTLTNLNTANVTGSGSSAVTTKQPRGGYVLISAGVDRVYGPRTAGSSVIESDDIVVAGP